MNIKIGIIENNKNYANELSELLYKWANTHSSTITVEFFIKGEELITDTSFNFNIFFIDIHLDGINGLHVAKILRQKKYAGEIVFLTAFNEYVFDGYEVHALNYILKPITYDKLKSCMNTVAKKLQSEHYIFRNRDTIEKIPYNKLIYISSSKHHMELITEEKTYRHLISIKDIMRHLPTQFIRCHRTLIINIDFVQKLEGRNVIMCNKIVLPVSDTYLQSVRKELENMVF